jgi:hypothetical protein
MEIVQFDQVQYQRYLDRSAMIIDATEPPPRIGDTPGFYKCKFCDHVKVCHLKETPVVNCRTCLHSAIEDNGEWRCTTADVINPNWDGYLTPETQRRSDCPFYTPNPVFHNKV